MKSNIQIPATLFFQMVLYIMDHEDPSHTMYQTIMAEVDRKIEALRRHDLYTLYKSAHTQEEKETARQKYLDAVGIEDSFRWEHHTSYDKKQL